MPVGKNSSIVLKILQPVVTSYLDLVPVGTRKVTSLNFELKLSYTSNGSFINEVMVLRAGE